MSRRPQAGAAERGECNCVIDSSRDPLWNRPQKRIDYGAITDTVLARASWRRA